MGVTTNLINKPLNPRAQDASPLAYNRAALYSGKALDFDGVNDYVDCGTLDVAFSKISFAFHFNADSFSNNCIFQKESVFRFIGVNTNQIDIVLATAGNSWYSKKMTLTNLESKDYFLTATYDGSELKAYLNGVLVDTLGDYSGSVVSVSQNVYVGRTNGGLYYNGKVSGARIFNTALTAAQIADLYNNPEKIVPTGVDNTALKLWLPMQEGAGTTAFNGAPDALGSEEVTNGTFDTDSDWTKGTGWSISGGKATLTNGTDSTYQIFQGISGLNTKTLKVSFDITNFSGVAEIRYPLRESITGNGSYVFYGVGTFDRVQFQAKSGSTTSFNVENVSVQEATGFGTISGATWTNGIGAPVAQTAVINWNKVSDGTNSVLIPQGLTAGRDLLGNLFENVRKQGALNLDGKSWAEVHDNASVDVQSFTLECWVNLEFNGTYQEFLSKGDSSSDRTFELYLNNTENQFGVLVNTVGITFAAQTINENQWYHVVASYNSTNDAIRGYVDSVEKLSTTGSINPNNTDGDVIIGAWFDKSLFKTNGQIAQPRIYNRALTAEEVQRNYNAGKNIYS